MVERRSLFRRAGAVAQEEQGQNAERQAAPVRQCWVARAGEYSGPWEVFGRPLPLHTTGLEGLKKLGTASTLPPSSSAITPPTDPPPQT
eukprot:2203817-Pyramimonas_sp.AAC.1